MIGLDGATFHLINPWVKNGNLPTFKKLMEAGAYGVLKSTLPPITIPAWFSLCSGKNPGKYGIYFFFERNPDNYNTKAIDPKNIILTYFWEIIKGTYVILYPPWIYCDAALNGIFISDNHKVCYPKGIIHELPKLSVRVDWERGIEQNIEEVHQVIKDELENVKYLLINKPWDLFFFVMPEVPDAVQHRWWQWMDEKHPLYKRSKYKDAILKVYQKIDFAMKDILNLVDLEKTTVFIISDHGFQPYYYLFSINRWLIEEGYLRVKNIDPIFQFLLKRGYDLVCSTPLKKFLPFWFEKIVMKKYVPSLQDIKVDWSNTKAYTFDGYGIFFNLVGRESKGVVSSRVYEELREEIIWKLKSFRNPFTGEKVIQEVYKREDIYSGPYLNKAPDLIIVPRRNYRLASIVGFYPMLKNFGHIPGGGTHDINGIFIAVGPDVKKGELIDDIKVTDIAPTILHLLGTPIPNDMDGRILKEIFKEDSKMYKTKVQYQDIHDKNKQKTYVSIEMKDDKISARLRKLGYL